MTLHAGTFCQIQERLPPGSSEHPEGIAAAIAIVASKEAQLITRVDLMVRAGDGVDRRTADVSMLEETDAV